ncbi:MAG: hypothetical protein WBC01_07155 [Solirubrobacterales bacterium]
MECHRRPFGLSSALLAISSVLLFGCGEEEHSTANPATVLEQASVAAKTIGSGTIDARAELQILADELSVSGRVELGGPFSRGSGRAPTFELAGVLASDAAEGGSSEAKFALTAAGGSAYLQSAGTSYRAAPQVVDRYVSLFEGGSGGGKDAGSLDLSSWLVEPTNEGVESIDGEELVHISGTADVAELGEQLGAVIDQLGLKASASELGEIERGFFEQATMDVYVAAEDMTPRRIELHLRWNGELEGGEPFDGAFDASLVIIELNEPQSIEVPQASQPLRGSVDELPPPLSGLGEYLANSREG